MNKEGPSPARVLVIAGFALSCFGLLLFLWLAFGGAVPFKPKGYQVEVAFDDAATLAEQADVRISGVSIGKVVRKDLAPEGNRTLATLEVKARFAPLRQDTRAILRQKTLLGETYVELTPGSRQAPMLQDGARLRDANVQPAVEFDELLRIFDPETRQAFQQWQQSLGQATGGQARDLNDALGSLAPFVSDAQDVVDILNNRRAQLKGLVKGTGETFEAITRDGAALQSLITDQRDVFTELSNRRESLAETFQVFPTFLRESRATVTRVAEFSEDTDPLLRELEPVLDDLQPTLAALRTSAPDVQELFQDLRPLTRASSRGLPALSRTLDGLDPTLAQFGPFLEQVNPILQYVEMHQATLADFLNTGASALQVKLPAPARTSPGTNGHALPQVIVTGAETLPAARRGQANRGNAYFGPADLAGGGLKDPAKLTLPAWDCANAGGPKPPTDTPACFVATPTPFQGKTQRFPQVLPSGPAGTLREGQPGDG